MNSEPGGWEDRKKESSIDLFVVHASDIWDAGPQTEHLRGVAAVPRVTNATRPG